MFYGIHRRCRQRVRQAEAMLCCSDGEEAEGLGMEEQREEKI